MKGGPRGRGSRPQTSATMRRLAAEGRWHGGSREALDRTPVKGPCFYCGQPGTTHDHKIPRSRGGTDDPENIVIACLSCNVSKGNRTPEEWAAGVPARRRSPAPRSEEYLTKLRGTIRQRIEAGVWFVPERDEKGRYASGTRS